MRATAIALLLCVAGAWATAEDSVVSCELARGRLLVPVLVDGNGPYLFLLDTCLRMPIVERELAATLYAGELPPNGTPVRLTQLRFGAFKADAPDAILASLTELSARLGRELGGILPAHQPGFEVAIDFSARQVRWSPIEKALLNATQHDTVVMSLDAAGAPIVETALGGNHMRRLRVDSASGGGLALTERTLAETGIATGDAHELRVPLSDGVILRQCRVTGMRIADTPLPNPICTILENGDVNRLGIEILCRFRMVLNYEAGLARFESLEKTDPSAPAPLLTYGLILQFNRDGLWEIAAAEGSPAYRAGLRTGDLLIEFNGAKLDGARAESIEEMLRPDTGYSVSLTCLRNGSRITAEMAPAPLL